MSKGFTLVEVISYIAVLGILGVSLTGVLSWSMKTYTKAKAMQETTWNAQRAMDIMMQEIREAKHVYTPTTLVSQLSLATPKYTSQGHQESFVDFFVCGDQLCFKKESQDPVALTSEHVRVSGLSFVRVQSSLTAESMRVTLRVEYNNPNNRPELTSVVELSSAASLR